MKTHVRLDDTPVWRTDEQKGFSTARWNEYKQLFTRVGNPSVHRISREGDVIEIASGSVVVYDTDDPYESIVTSKDYVYSLQEPSPLVESLDDRRRILATKELTAIGISITILDSKPDKYTTAP